MPERLTYEEMLVLLSKEKGLAIHDPVDAINKLKRIGYYVLINGYKEPFQNNKGEYLKDASIDDLYAFYIFDRDLREVFFSCIETVEQHIKEVISQVFTERFGTDPDRYTDPITYSIFEDIISYRDLDNQNAEKGSKEHSSHLRKKKQVYDQCIKVKTVTNDLKYRTNNNDSSYIQHHKEKEDGIPFWVALKTVSFGTMTNMFSVLPKSLKSKVCRNFETIRPNQMEKMLELLQNFRNRCAHNEKIFDYVSYTWIRPGKIHNVFDQLPQIERGTTPKRKTIVSHSGKNDLFAALISLKYLLTDKDDFDWLVDSIEKNIEYLADNSILSKKEVLKQLNFPYDWSKIKEEKKLGW